MPEEKHSNVFASKEEEDVFCLIFKALAEEWGVAHITILAPESWKDLVVTAHNFKVEYTTLQSLVILVIPEGETWPVIVHTTELSEG